MPGRAVPPLSARPTQTAPVYNDANTDPHAAPSKPDKHGGSFYIMKTDQRDVFLKRRGGWRRRHVMLDSPDLHKVARTQTGTGNTTPRLSKLTQASCSALGKAV